MELGELSEPRPWPDPNPQLYHVIFNQAISRRWHNPQVFPYWTNIKPLGHAGK